MSDNRVLIIDDDPRICRIMKRVADELGVESSVTDNPELFESANLSFEPNVIFMDLQMPKIDGIELLRKLAELHSSAAIILASGMDKSVIETTREFGKSLGLNMAGILQKPIDIDKTKEILEQHFEVSLKQSTKAIQITREELAQAIENDDLVVYYQPQVSFESGQVLGVEALVRWQHPDHGLLFPDTFIPLAEKHKELITPLTYRVLETALQDDVARRETGFELNLSINLSARLLGDLSLPDQVEELLNSYHFDHNRLLLEVTESGAMEEPSSTMDILTRLRLKNIQLSIDDFGTGFSSLVQLYRLPFTELKVDKSFVMNAMTSKEAAAISRITIELGHSLGLKVVAEGVEDRETYNWLKTIGCDIAQGYYLSRPIGADDFLGWLQDYQPT